MENKEIIQEMVNIEKNAEDLYRLYQDRFAEDARFWDDIADEETTHGSLIRLAVDVLRPRELEKIFTYDDLQQLKELNASIRGYIENFDKNPPTKEEAYRFAIDLEKSGYEAFYQGRMTESSDSKQMEIFQKMNRDCKDHAERIEKLLDGSAV